MNETNVRLKRIDVNKTERKNDSIVKQMKIP